MFHTVLRTFAGNAGEINQLRLPLGVRRVLLQPELSNTSLSVSFDKEQLEANSGQRAGLNQPFDSTWHVRDEGPIYFRSSLKGAYIRVDVWHIKSPAGVMLDTGGPGGVSVQKKQRDAAAAGTLLTKNRHTAVFVPSPGKPAHDTDLGGVLWKYPVHATNWMDENNWSISGLPVSSQIGNDFDNTPDIRENSSLLYSNSWEPRGQGIPTGATIKSVKVLLQTDIEQLPIDGDASSRNYRPVSQIQGIKLARLSIIRDGRIGWDYDYTADRSNSNPSWSSSQNNEWIEYLPKDDPLWGETWAVTDFESPNAANPTVNITTIQEGSAAKNEIQKVLLSGATGGTFTLTFNQQTTSALAWDASAATIDSALEGLSTIGTGDIAVTKVADGNWDVTFQNAMAGEDVSLLTGNGTNLTGAASSTVRTIQQGGSSSKNTIVVFEVLPSAQSEGRDRLEFYDAWHGPEFLYRKPTLLGRTAYFNWRTATQASLQTLVDTALGAGNILVTYVPKDDDRNENCFGRDTWWFEWTGTYTGRDMRFFTRPTGWEAANAGTTADPNPYTRLGSAWPPTIFNGSISSFTNSGDYTEERWDRSYAHWECRGTEPASTTDSKNYTYSGIKQSPGLPGTAATNEIQEVLLHNSPTGGTFALTFHGQTTSGISPTADANTFRVAFEGLGVISSGDVSITKPADFHWKIEFTSTYAGTDVRQMTCNTSSLTGGGVNITTIQEAGVGENEIQKVELIGGVSTGQWGLTWNPGGGDETTSALAGNAASAAVLSALGALSTPSASDFAVTGDAGGPYYVEFKNTYAATDVNQMKMASGYGVGRWGFILATQLIPRSSVKGNTFGHILDALIEVDYEV